MTNTTSALRFSSPACSALSYIGGVSPLPSHVLSQSAPAELATLEFNLAPTVTSGYFTFGQHRPAEITSLLANKEHPDAGEFNLEGIIQLVSSDQAVQIEQFLEGETNFLESLPPDRKQEFRENADLQVYEYPGNTWDYLGFNTADPTNPNLRWLKTAHALNKGYTPSSVTSAFVKPWHTLLMWMPSSQGQCLAKRTACLRTLFPQAGRLILT
ncbi:MAG UNVERIFIED_CONTAM: ABC transporter substrate-binding protein [Anaerolineae bacterium]